MYVPLVRASNLMHTRMRPPNLPHTVSMLACHTPIYHQHPHFSCMPLHCTRPPICTPFLQQVHFPPPCGIPPPRSWLPFFKSNFSKFVRTPLTHVHLFSIYTTKLSLISLLRHLGPTTTKRLLIARYLGDDHILYTHSHFHIHAWSCVHVRSHVVDLFIVNDRNV
jgi:hypothetical protein